MAATPIAIASVIVSEAIWRAVRAVVDPELGGVTIGDLGLVHDARATEDGAVVVELLPTFLGCPALSLMAKDVVRAVLEHGATSCSVEWRAQPAWDSSRITQRGVKQLAAIGIAVATAQTAEPDCPFCGRKMLRQINPVGATACRAVAWCGGCRSAIDVIGSARG